MTEFLKWHQYKNTMSSMAAPLLPRFRPCFGDGQRPTSLASLPATLLLAHTFPPRIVVVPRGQSSQTENRTLKSVHCHCFSRNYVQSYSETENVAFLLATRVLAHEKSLLTPIASRGYGSTTDPASHHNLCLREPAQTVTKKCACER